MIRIGDFGRARRDAKARMTDLLDKAARLACWRGPVELEPLKGGLTNISFVATCRGEKFVVRCGEDIPVHHVFRDRERAASVAAFEAGLSPEIIHVEPGIMVLRFIEGRTLAEDDLRANIGRLVPLLKDCHTKVGRHVRGPVNAFWVFQVIRDYVTLLDADRRYLDAGRPARAGPGAAADRVRPSRSPARQLHRRRQQDLADRLGVWRLRHGDVRSRQPVVQRRLRRGRGRGPARCLF